MERKNYLESQLLNGQLFEFVLNQANIGIYVLDEKGKFVLTNDYLCKIVGYDSSELLQKDPLFLIEPSEKSRIRTELKKRLTGYRERASYHTIVVNSKGKELDIALDVSTLNDREGRVIGVLGFVRDITGNMKQLKERRRFEEQALMIEKLTALGRLATTIVHQINNPLEAMKNYLYLLKEDLEDDPDMQLMISKIEQELFRIAGMTSQIIDFAVPTTDRFLQYDITLLMDETLKLMDKKIRNSNVELDIEFDDELPTIKGAPDQLKQAFINIIFNALESMENGGTLSIRVEKSGPHLELRFSDTGQGISGSDLKDIFDPFFSTKDPEQYVGLGLSVCLLIIHNHGGMLRVESEPGRGSCVIVTLPALHQ